MISLKYPVIVEGKYDKITLENIVETLIISTNGFGIFKDREKCALIKGVAEKCGGIIVLTDSDSAGNLIRAHLKNIIGGNALIVNVYVPCVKGKEKRKDKASKEGFLGVEGMQKEVILSAFEKSGLLKNEKTNDDRKITKTDMFLFGLSGKEDSVLKRKQLLEYLELPQNLSSNAALDIFNTYFSYTEFSEVIKKWQNAQTKS
ncbi:MAG: DUF4093 domain-containing protein [Clostridia bacterium]|nr:DUF4093 domain-containing protein [Clostridia bacterium]